eukprot:14921258-Heterocapsa_arctica.AAC.1
MVPVEPSDMEVSYCSEQQEDAEDACAVWADLGWLEGAEEKAARANLLHPGQRSSQQQYLLELSALTSQAPAVRKPRTGLPPVSREERSQTWRAALGTKTVAARLSQVCPE